MSDERRTVLVIDDAPSNIDVLRNILISRYKVKVATSGVSGIKIAAKVPQPDLILVDIIMPEMDGFEVCKQLKASPETQAIPVMFVTGTASDDEVAKGMDLGARGFIMKPLNPEHVLDVVGKNLSAA